MSLSAGPLTASADPTADQLIGRHLARIRHAILASCGAGNIACIALVGGFGRGEGGVRRTPDGTLRPVNDYDILVVTRREGLLARLWLRRCLKRQEPALTGELGIRVDIACKTPAMLRAWPACVEAYEVAVGHQVLWGDEAPLQRIPWREAAALPVSEASRYLFNRGAALLWARRLVEAQGPGRCFVALSMTDSRMGPGMTNEQRFILVAIQKAWLAWGDAVLLLNGRYTALYRDRAGRLAEIELPPALDFVARRYPEALHFKLQPDFAPYAAADLPTLLDETIQRHERVWRWVEMARGAPAAAPAAFWRAYHRRRGPRLGERGRRLYHLALNLWRVRPRTLAGLLEHPEERLAGALPLLLFDVAWDQALAATLAASFGLSRPADRASLSDRLIALWHPGEPFVGG